MSEFIWNYFINILVAVDELVNAIALGSPHETISSRVGRNYPGTLVCKIINSIVFWKYDHCQNSIEPKDYENGALLK